MTKEEIRKIVAFRKQSLTDTVELSQMVIKNLMSVNCFVSSNIIMTYVDFGKEVRTVPLISMVQKEKRIVVPYCSNSEIKLFLLKNLNELAPGTMGILEPKIELRRFSDRRININELQLVLVPGIAFDPQGGRLGRGKGYYDRFLKKLPKNTITIGLAFDIQIFEQIPILSHDVPLNMIVTESNVFCAKNLNNR